jgi:hypothetical protein
LTATTDSTFLRDYLKVRYLHSFEAGELRGVAGSAVGDGLRVKTGACDGAGNQTSADMMEPVSAEARVALLYVHNSVPAAVTYAQPDGYRLVFFGFGFEGICSDAVGRNTRAEVMGRVLGFLDGSDVTATQDDWIQPMLPSDFVLHQNYPNPFNPTTVITFTIAPALERRQMSLDLYDVLGRKVATLLTGPATAGLHRVEFDARRHSSGVYFYRLEVAGQTATRKMVIVR